jgi:cytochrome c biogenesis protein CcdA
MVDIAELATILLIGFLLGIRHALDADYLAAVATLATSGRSVGHTVRLGVAWGMGHTLTLVLFGGAMLTAGLAVPTEAARALELAVGVMLSLLGANVLYRMWRDRARFHSGRSHRDGIGQVHAHRQAGGASEPEPARHGHWRDFALRALVVGMVHGMAGSAALILLSVEAVDSVAWGLGYIAIFGAGSVLGMALLSAAIALPLRLTSRHLTRAHGALAAAVGVATLTLGYTIIWHYGTASRIAG